MKSYSSALSASRTIPNRAGPIIPAIAAVMIIRRFVSILAEAGYILRLLARVEARPRTILQAALQVHTAAIPSLKRGGKGWPDYRRATVFGAMGLIYQAPCRGGRTKCGVFSTPSPHDIRSAKSAGSQGMARYSESFITGNRQPK